VYIILVEIPEGDGGAYMKCPPWWGYGYFLELHIGHLCTKYNLQTSVEKRVPSFFNFPLLIYLKIKNPP